MNINLENDDGSPVDSLCYQCRSRAMQNLTQVDASRGVQQLDLGDDTPVVYWKQVHSAFEHIPSCDSCTRWVKSLYIEACHNPFASAASRLYHLTNLKVEAKTREKITEKELSERDRRCSQYCCSSMFKAVELEDGHAGLKIVLGGFRDENKWVFIWKESRTAITDTVYCPWCGEKMPDKAFVG